MYHHRSKTEETLPPSRIRKLIGVGAADNEWWSRQTASIFYFALQCLLFCAHSGHPPGTIYSPGFDQEFSSRARHRTNTRESIKKLLSIAPIAFEFARVVIVPRWNGSIVNDNIRFERGVVAFLINLRHVFFRFLHPSSISAPDSSYPTRHLFIGL